MPVLFLSEESSDWWFTRENRGIKISLLNVQCLQARALNKQAILGAAPVNDFLRKIIRDVLGVWVNACSMRGGDKSARRKKRFCSRSSWSSVGIISPPCLEANIITIEHISEYTLSCTKPEKLKVETPKTDSVSGSNRLP
jgi:hypothetical protein